MFRFDGIFHLLQIYGQVYKKEKLKIGQHLAKLETKEKQHLFTHSSNGLVYCATLYKFKNNQKCLIL